VVVTKRTHFSRWPRGFMSRHGGTIQRRPMVVDDLPAAIRLRKEAEGVELAEGDSEQELPSYLLRFDFQRRPVGGSIFASLRVPPNPKTAQQARCSSRRGAVPLRWCPGPDLNRDKRFRKPRALMGYEGRCHRKSRRFSVNFGQGFHQLPRKLFSAR
jgi:hypothetical protein